MSTDTVASSGPRLVYQPALDGVRALAVIAVLLFHAGVPGFGGGYLGVSVFFTLSGYLITSLLVSEFDQLGRIDLGAFYGRRLRRLLPASVLTVGLVVVASRLTDWFDGVSSLRGHVLGSLFQVANWVFLAGGGSYQDLLAETNGTPSPLEHFWSLAIEEQFYWMWPMVMLGLLTVFPTRRARGVAVGSITAVAIVAAPVIAAVWGADAAYWATPARFAEILVGAFLSVVLRYRMARGELAVLAPAALGALGVAVVLFPTAGGPAYEGALPLVAVASGALLVGLQVEGPVRDALSVRPLVFVGKISYGVYLYHWPIYVVLDADRLGVGGVALVAVRLATTLLVSLASYHLVEQPIRHTRRITFRPTLAGSLAATSLTAVASFLLVPAALGNYWESDTVAADAAAIEVVDTPLVPLATTGTTTTGTTTTGTTTTSSVPPTTIASPSATTDRPTASVATTATSTTIAPIPDLARPVRALVVGDSTAEAIGNGLIAWAVEHPDLAQVEIDVERGCGFLLGGDRWVEGWEPVPSRCERWVETRVPDQVTALVPDVVVLMVTPWDVIDRRWDGGDAVTPFDAEFAERLAADYESLVGGLVADGVASILWIEPPLPNPLWMNRREGQADPARHAIVASVVDALAAEFPGRLRVLPFDTWHTDAGFDTEREIRPDGVHWTPEASLEISEDYLGERVVRAALGLEFP